jgi:hypothetical protein
LITELDDIYLLSAEAILKRTFLLSVEKIPTVPFSNLYPSQQEQCIKTDGDKSLMFVCGQRALAVQNTQNKQIKV